MILGLEALEGGFHEENRAEGSGSELTQEKSQQTDLTCTFLNSPGDPDSNV